MTEFVKKIRYSQLSAEEESNLNAAFGLLLCAIAVIITLILDEIGVFYVEVGLFRVAALISVVVAILPYILIRTTNVGNRPWFKYCIMGCAFIVALTVASLLAYHGILLVFLPIFISLMYYDQKVHITGLIESLAAAILSSTMCYLFDNMSMDFWTCLVYANNPEDIVLSQEFVEKFVQNNPQLIGDVPKFMTTFVGIPQAMILMAYGSMAYIILRFRQRNKGRQLREIEAVQSHVLYSLSDIIENRDMETGGHVRRAKDVVEILVSHLYPVPEDENPRYREYLIKSAVTHDIGKIAIDDDLLRKKDRVTPEEYEEIKIHPCKSVEIIDVVLGPIENEEFLDVAKNLAKYHHEWYNGTGYPEGLKGTAIPLEARIMALADVFDALITERCYRETITYNEAYDIIKAGMGTQFDPDLMQVFDRSFKELKAYYEMNKLRNAANAQAVS